jgi:hypothetical protein
MHTRYNLISQSIAYIFTFAPCMLLHLLYSKPTHALLLNTLSHPHFKTLKLLKLFCKNIIKNPTCFGHYCVTILRGHLSYLVHYHFSACLLRPVHNQTSHRQVRRAHTHTHTHRQHTATYRISNWTKQASGEMVMH